MGKCNRCGKCCVNEDCEHLDCSGTLAICKIYGSQQRPQKCILFPQAPPILISECGYFFKDTWENNKIVKFGSDL